MKKSLAMLLALVMLLSMVGCGKKENDNSGSKVSVTVGEVRKKVVEATKQIKELRKTMSFGLTLNIAMNSEGFSFDTSISTRKFWESIVAGDPAAGYLKSTTVTSYGDEDDTEEEITFILPQSGELVVYSYDGYSKEWDIYSDFDGEYAAMFSESLDLSFINDIDEKDLTMANQTESVNGSDAYVLSFTLSGDQLSQWGLDIPEITDSEVDISEFSCPIAVCIDTESFRPVRITVKMDALVEPLTENAQDSMGDIFEGANMEVSIEDVVIDLYYNDLKIPELPAEAEESAKLSLYESEQPDGSFIIINNGAAARIVCSNGWLGIPANYNRIRVCDSNYDHFLDVKLYPAMSHDEFVDTLLEDAYYSEDECTILDPIGKYEMMMCSYIGQYSDYYAFTQLGDAWVVVNVYAEAEDDIIPAMTAVTSMIREYPYDQVTLPGSEPDIDPTENTQPIEDTQPVGNDTVMSLEDLLAKLIEATDNENSRQCLSSCEIVITMSTATGGATTTLDTNISIDSDVIVSKDPFAGYTQATFHANMLGNESMSDVALYVVEEDGQLISYQRNNNEGWVRTAASDENRERITNGAGFQYLTQLGDDEIMLAEDMETIDNKQMYVLCCLMSGSNLQNFGFDPSTLAQSEDSVSGYLTVFYIDAETFLPAYAWVDMDETVNALKESLLAAVADSAPEDLETFTSCDGYFIDFVYNIPQPEVPAEAKN